MDKGVVYFELSLILQVKGTTEIVWYRNCLRGRLSWVRMPTGTRDFLVQNHPVLLRGPPCFLLIGNQGSFLELKEPRCKADHSFTAAVRMGGTVSLFSLYTLISWTGTVTPLHLPLREEWTIRR